MFPLNVRSTVAAVGSFRALHPKEVAEAPRSASLPSKWPSAAMPACRASQPALCIHTTASAACWLNQAMVFLLLKPLVKKLKAGGKTLAWFSWIASFSSPKVFIPLFFNLFKAPENGNSQDKTFPKENPSLSFKNMKIKHFEASFVFLSYEAIHWLWPKSSLTHIPPKLPFCKQAIKEKSLAQSQSSPLYLEMQNDLRCPILKLVIEIRDLDTTCDICEIPAHRNTEKGEQGQLCWRNTEGSFRAVLWWGLRHPHVTAYCKCVTLIQFCIMLSKPFRLGKLW